VTESPVDISVAFLLTTFLFFWLFSNVVVVFELTL
jgi:hypothetical protein